MIDFLQENEEFYLTKNDESTLQLAQNLNALLNSNEEANQQLGLEIALGGGINEIFFYDLLLLYLWNRSQVINELAEQVLEKYLPTEIFIHLQNNRKTFYYGASDETIEHYLQNIASQYIDGGELGMRFYRMYAQGKKFCLSYPNSFVEICEETKKNNTLSLDGLKLKSIQPNVKLFKKLKILYLNNNILTKLPKELAELDCLNVLNLQKNQFKTFPKSLFKLKNLFILNLSANKIKKIPSNIDELRELQYLNLIKNKITDIPESLTQLKELKYLGLKDNPIAAHTEKINWLREALPHCKIEIE